MVRVLSGLYLVLAFIIGFGAGYLVFRGASPGQPTPEQISISQLKQANKAVSGWGAIVNGELSKRTKYLFVLSRDGDSITLPLAEGTVFLDAQNSKQTVDFTALPLGTTINGFVNINWEKGTFASGTYTVIKK